MQASSNIDDAQYNDETRVLTITFKSGGQYEYSGVPREVFEGLDTSLSPGSYFYRQIKDRFPTTRVS